MRKLGPLIDRLGPSIEAIAGLALVALCVGAVLGLGYLLELLGSLGLL